MPLHGWAYAPDGNLMETPAEPPDSTFKLTVKHPAYSVVEVGRLIFAFMGPAEKQPPFPRHHQKAVMLWRGTPFDLHVIRPDARILCPGG